MEYCCHVWAGTPSCYLELLDELQKLIFRTVGLSLVGSLENLVHHRNVASLSLIYTYYFDRYLSELAQLVVLPYSHDFLSPILDVTSIFMSTIPFLAQLDSVIFWL